MVDLIKLKLNGTSLKCEENFNRIQLQFHPFITILSFFFISKFNVVINYLLEQPNHLDETEMRRKTTCKKKRLQNNSNVQPNETITQE